MVEYWRDASKALAKHIKIKLKEITLAHVAVYQNARLDEGRAPKTINGELSVLRQLLKHAGLWYRFADYRTIRNTRPAIGRALTSEEQARLFEVAQSRSDWLNAFTAGVLGAFCDMRGCEIKALQWKDVDLTAGVLDIRHSKTPAGWRAPTLNSVCKESLPVLRAKAILADHARPEHYLFPATVKGKLDLSQHAKGWRSAWRSMRRKAATSDEGGYLSEPVNRSLP